MDGSCRSVADGVPHFPTCNPGSPETSDARVTTAPRQLCGKAILFLRLVRHRPYPSTCPWPVALGILCLVLSRPVSFHCLIPINVPTPFHHDINACERHPVASPWYHIRSCLLHSDRNIERLPVYIDQVMSK